VLVKETVEVEKEVTTVVEVEKEVTTVVKETVVVEKEPVAADEMSGVQELRVCAAFFAGSGDMALLDPPRRGTWSFHSLLWTMLVFGDTAGNVIPDKSLAEAWEVSEDGTVYTFFLRKQAQFSDGTPITAEHVVGSFGYLAMMNHSEASGFRGNFGTGRRLYWDIVGMMDVPAEAEYDQFGVLELPGVQAVDDFTVQITIEKPAINFIPRLTVAGAVFNPADLEAAKEAEYDLLDYWPAHAVYSGPYKIVEAVPGDRYAMVPNEHYFGPKPQIDKITMFQVSPDVNTRLTAFANKEIDLLVESLGGDSARQAFADPYMREAMTEVPSWQVQQFWITPNEPLDDVHVRRAFSMAIDKDALVKILNAGSDVELYRRVNMHRNPGVPNCQEETAEVTPLPFDPAAAREELAQSKYGEGVVDMEIHIYAANASVLPECEATQLMLQENLGMNKVTVHTEQIPNMMDPPYPLHLWRNGQMPWHPDITDTLINMAQFVRDEEWKPEDPRPFIAVAYMPELKEIVEEAMDEQDPARKCQLVKQAGQLWNDDVFSLDFAVPVQYYLVAPWVKDIQWYQNIGQAKPLNIEDVWVAKH
jgi:oligopeptide transport system substrate-binding protein